jgi:hypothetical protein
VEKQDVDAQAIIFANGVMIKNKNTLCLSEVSIVNNQNKLGPKKNC